MGREGKLSGRKGNGKGRAAGIEMIVDLWVWCSDSGWGSQRSKNEVMELEVVARS